MPAPKDRRQVTERLALVLTEHGMQRSVARVMAAFLITEQPALTQGELTEELGVSSGSVSSAVSALTSVGMLERVPVAGSRRDHHRLRDDAWGVLFSKQNHAATAMLDAAREAIEATEPGGTARRRLDRMRSFYEFLLSELPALVERWRQQEDSESGQ